MSADRELLELAAKAAGITPQWRTPSSLDCKDAPDPIGWNPLLNDGDALRLAVVLGISVDPRGRSVCAISRSTEHAVILSCVGSDHCVVTRRAIVCIAAEIGRAK